MKMPQFPWLPIYKVVRAIYQDVTKSIVQNLPIPTPSIERLFPGTNKASSYAHMPVNQILHHIVALGYDCHFYRAGFEEDWSEENTTCLLQNDDVHHCDFFRDAH